jgi:hypothetical protein
MKSVPANRPKFLSQNQIYELVWDTEVTNYFKTCYNISVLFILSLWGKEISYRVFPFNVVCVLLVVWVVKCGRIMM